jgi:hypothetical protein
MITKFKKEKLVLVTNYLKGSYGEVRKAFHIATK